PASKKRHQRSNCIPSGHGVLVVLEVRRRALIFENTRGIVVVEVTQQKARGAEFEARHSDQHSAMRACGCASDRFATAGFVSRLSHTNERVSQTTRFATQFRITRLRITVAKRRTLDERRRRRERRTRTGG
ncbi:MAG TPA: hypothetical protein VE010_00925, partial [Thermoanaerobaculia bacterium]|nr:hypothetical protein [Thermoanaerobaculia bacterium]